MDKVTRRALAIGVGTLVIAAGLSAAMMPANRPFAVFALPPLFAALVGRWRPTLVVGALSLGCAVIVGVASPLTPVAIAIRMFVTLLLTAMAVAVARLREREQAQLVALASTSSLYHVFEAGLLPAPEIPAGYDVVVDFVSSEHEMTLGGDLVDAMELPDGRLAVVIGDVCGHGPREAAFATAVRAGWRTIVRTHRPDPSAWLSHLRRTLYSGTVELPYVTMCTGIVDRAVGEMTLAIAGHPPPIALGDLVHPIVVRFGPPLGVDMLTRWPNHRIPIGDGLLLYTDGLVDNPAASGPADRWGECGLVSWIRGWTAENSVPVTPPDRRAFVDALVAAARSGRTIHDDLATLLVAVDRRAGHPSTSRRAGQDELIEIHHPA